VEPVTIEEVPEPPRPEVVVTLTDGTRSVEEDPDRRAPTTKQAATIPPEEEGGVVKEAGPTRVSAKRKKTKRFKK
jgi:hypothetical protein